MKSSKNNIWGSLLGGIALLLWVALWSMLIFPPLRPLFGKHAIPQIFCQLVAASLLSIAAGFLANKKWWWLSAFSFGSAILLFLGMYSS